MSTNYYDILGVNKNASKEEIKKAYNTLSRKHHPDRPSGSEEKFKEISEAYNTLSDPQKKQQYDAMGSGFMGDGGKGFSNFSGNFDSNFFEDIFGSFGGGNYKFFYQNSQEPVKGQDILCKTTISLEELFYGTTTKLSFQTYVGCGSCKSCGFTGRKTCTACKGKGYTSNGFNLFEFRSPCNYCNQTGQKVGDVCKTCQGEGRVVGSVTHTLKVPKGFDVSKTLNYQGLGEVGVRTNNDNKLHGDLLLKVSLENHSIFTKVNHDLHMDYYINLEQAIMGSQLTITSIDQKKHILNIPAIKENTSFYIENAGFWYSHKSNLRGKIVVNVKIQLPNLHSSKSQEKFQDFWNTIKS